MTDQKIELRKVLPAEELTDEFIDKAVSLLFDDGSSYTGIVKSFSSDGDNELIILQALDSENQIGLPLCRLKEFYLFDGDKNGSYLSISIDNDERINLEFKGNIPAMGKAIVRLMIENADIKALILASADVYLKKSK